MMRAILFGSVVVLGACHGGTPASMPILPVDYATTYTQVRPCRSSTDHDLDNVTVFADPTSLEPYQMRDNPFPEGSVVVKPQYSPNDTSCGGPIIQWTVMQKLATGSSPNTDDWHWQRITAQRKVITDNDITCINCHADCGGPNSSDNVYGYLYTCSAPDMPTP
jgi:hypothetical protein